jgi:hypothetical protein
MDRFDVCEDCSYKLAGMKLVVRMHAAVSINIARIQGRNKLGVATHTVLSECFNDFLRSTVVFHDAA